MLVACTAPTLFHENTTCLRTTRNKTQPMRPGPNPIASGKIYDAIDVVQRSRGSPLPFSFSFLTYFLPLILFSFFFFALTGSD